MTTSDTRPQLTLPNADAMQAPSIALSAARDAHSKAAQAYTDACTHFAAGLVRELWPDAETLVFDAYDDEDGGVNTSLMCVYNADGVLTWFNPSEIDPSEIDVDLSPAELEHAAAATIEQALEEALAADWGCIPPLMTTGGVAANALKGCSGPRQLSISVAVDEHTPAPERITFGQSADRPHLPS